MSLNRLIYYSAIIGGWSAFLGWMASEFLLNPLSESGGRIVVVLTCAMVGGAIGIGLNLVAGMANGRLTQQIKRVVPGLLAGGVGGAVGGFIGDVLFSTLQLPRAFGWMLMGAGIGVVEGLYERSPAKLRNGLIGGSIGGLVGGFLFDPISNAIGTHSAMSSRATAFVILGMCIGVLIGLVKVVLKDAWLTVLDGYRPGRQLILSDAKIALGRAEYAALPFMGRSDNDLEPEHAHLVRRPDGRFILEDNHSRLGTSVNNVPVDGSVVLEDDDVIRIGANTVRFSDRQRHAEEGGKSAITSAQPSAGTTYAGMRPYPTPAAPAPIQRPPVSPTSMSPGPKSSAQLPPPLRPMTDSPTKVAAAQSTSPTVPRPASPHHSPTGRTPAPAANKTPTTPVPPTVASPPESLPDGIVRCPNGHPVPRSQRYCIQCDTYF